MAGKKTGTTRPGKSAKKQHDHDSLIIDAALDLAVRSGWRSLTMADIANETGLKLAEIRVIFPCKATILNGLVRRIDEQVLAEGDADGDSVRDRLFDLLMRRFDALNAYKPAVETIVRESWGDPAAALITGSRMLSSMQWMLEAAGVSTRGPLGLVRCNALGLIYAKAVRAWLKDSSEDMTATMAELDKGLRQAERLESVCRGR